MPLHIQPVDEQNLIHPHGAGDVAGRLSPRPDGGRNAQALKSYLGFGFEPYALDPAAGQASFMHKWL